MEVDLAILACGLTIPVYPSVLADEWGYILGNSGSSIAVVDSPKQRAKVDRSWPLKLDGIRQTVPLR
jgi:long-subunit acyl-CoA synthetase (AMP-forming)